MKKLRRITEAEVIAEFLKNEFYESDFDRDRERFERIAMEPDITNEAENAIRRALLFRRRGHMWRELPADTQWWRVEVGVEDVPKLRIFARARWPVPQHPRACGRSRLSRSSAQWVCGLP